MYRSAVSSTGDPVPRLRPRALVALFAAALAVAVVAAAGPSSSTTVADEPTPVAVTAGSLDWGVKGSFRRYVGEDGITVSGGVTRTSGTTPQLPVPGFSWPLESGQFDPSDNSLELSYGGEVRFVAHCEVDPCALDMRISSPRVVITGDESTLYADFQSRSLETGQIVDYGEIAVAALDHGATTPATAGGTTTWDGIVARLTPESADPFAHFYVPGTELDSLAIAYEGPGGVPQPTVEQWTLPGTPLFEQVASNALFTGGPRVFPDPDHGLVHAQVGTTLRALDEDTLAVVATTTIPAVSNPAGASDRETGTFFVVHAGRPSAYDWNPGTQSYDVVQLPGTALATGTNATRLAYDTANDRLIYLVSPGTIVTWTRSEDGWVRNDYTLSGLTSGLRVSMAVDGDGTVIVTESSSGAVRTMPRTVVFGSGVATLTPIAGGVPVPTNYDTDWLDVHAVDGRAYLVTRLGVVQEIRKQEGAYVAHGAPLATSTPAYVTFSDFADRYLYIVGASADIVGIRDGRVTHRVRSELAYYGSPTAAAGAVYSWSATVGNDGLLKFAHTATSPTVSEQPQDRLVALGVGETSKPLTLTAAATAGEGALAPAVRWQTRTPGATRWQDVPGAESTALALTVDADDQGSEFRAVFTNAAGSIATAGARITVNTAPAVLVQPSDVTAVAGHPALFKVMPGGNPEPEIVWQRRVDGFWQNVDPDSGDFTVDGGFLTIGETVAEMSGATFRARLRAEIAPGETVTVFTRAAKLTVAEPPRQQFSFGGGYVDWGVAERWRCYVVGNVARGGIETLGGVSKVPGTLAQGSLCAGRNAGSEVLRFPVLGGSFDSETGELEVRLGGRVRFWGHAHHAPGNTTPLLDTTLSNLRVIATGDSGRLVADASGATMDDPLPRTHIGVELATLDLSGVSPVPSSEGVSWTGIGSALAISGVSVFGSYGAGEPFDPLTLALSFASNPVVDPPAAKPPKAKPPRIVARAGTAKLDRRGTARVVQLRCAAGGPACRVASKRKVRVKVGGRIYPATVLAPRRIASGSRAWLRVKLSRPALRSLAERRGAKRRATLRIAVRVRAGSRKAERSLRVVLRLPAAKR